MVSCVDSMVLMLLFTESVVASIGSIFSLFSFDAVDYGAQMIMETLKMLNIINSNNNIQHANLWTNILLGSKNKKIKLFK